VFSLRLISNEDKSLQLIARLRSRRRDFDEAPPQTGKSMTYLRNLHAIPAIDRDDRGCIDE